MDERSNKSSPVYIQIAQMLREQIISGKLTPGDILPSESALCNKYNISRDTARKGLRKLENEGLIFSRPKIGYFVNAPKHADVVFQFAENIPGCTTQYLDISGKRPELHVQEALHIPPSSKVIEFIQLIRNADGEPVGYDVKYLPYRRAYPSVESEMQFAVFPDITYLHMTPYAYYTEFTVQAVVADTKQASILLCPEGAPLMLIKRLMIDRNGTYIAYALRYLLQPHGKLLGYSGYVDSPAHDPQKEQEEPPL